MLMLPMDDKNPLWFAKYGFVFSLGMIVGFCIGIFPVPH